MISYVIIIFIYILYFYDELRNELSLTQLDFKYLKITFALSDKNQTSINFESICSIRYFIVLSKLSISFLYKSLSYLFQVRRVMYMRYLTSAILDLTTITPWYLSAYRLGTSVSVFGSTRVVRHLFSMSNRCCHRRLIHCGMLQGRLQNNGCTKR